MDRSYAEHNQLTTWKLLHPILVYNVDGNLNEVGSITEIMDVILQFNDHSKYTSFAVTSLGKQDIILGFTWLQEHNPEINWQTQEVTMSCCPDKCHTWQTEVARERQVHQKSLQHIWTCRLGPHPTKTDEEVGAGPEDSTSNSGTGLPPEGQRSEGDHLFYASLLPEAESVWATQTTSQ